MPTSLVSRTGSWRVPVIAAVIPCLLPFGAVAQTATPVYPRAVVINFDPILERQGMQRLHAVYGWTDPAVLAAGYVSDLRASSHDLVNFRITRTINADVYPVKADGFQYTDTTFQQCWPGGGTAYCHSPDGVDYRAVARDYDLARKVDSGEIDEVLMFGAPYFGYWESTMAGRGGYWCNSSPQTRIPCSRIFIMMGFNYERGVGEMLEDYGHRTESIMRRVYGSWSAQQTHAWNRFTLYDKQIPGEAACGNVHFAPNSTSDYDWGNSRYVDSTCDWWLNSFPVGYPDEIGPKRSVNKTEWGYGDMRLHHRWWFSHIPHVDGSITEYGMTRLNNWWAYMQDFNHHPESNGDFAPGGSVPPAVAFPATPGPVTASPHDQWSPKVNASGRVVWSGSDGEDFEIYSANANSSSLIQITDNAMSDESPEINARGQIVWQSFDGQDFEIYTANADGTNLHQITSNTVNDWHPAISDSGRIVWDAFDGQDYEIYSANADGTDIHQVTSNSASSGYPREDVWPRINASSRIVWFGYDGTFWQIYSANADGTDLVNLSNATFDNEYPQINDAGRVVWQGWPSSWNNTHCEIYSGDAAGGTVVRITDNSYEDWHPQVNDRNLVVWMARAEAGKWVVRSASATGGSLATVSSTAQHSQYPQADNAGRIAWQGFDGHDWEIYASVDGQVQKITDNNYDDRAPRLNDTQAIVWHAASGVGADGDVSQIWSSTVTRPISADFDGDRDVDLADFGHLQRCLTATRLEPVAPGCDNADTDDDGHVDELDLSRFLACVSGADIPGNPDCDPD
ncbi:MAG: hypothetical protein KA354_22315 [Phycisphaerae bacterium]|nr:hypothetical protein [Phycisphaerae bacterium]